MTDEETNSWVRTGDFVEVHYKVEVTNVTTHVSLAKGNNAEIVELMPAGIMIKVPRTAAALGHIVMIDLTPKVVPGESLPQPALSATGKVIESEKFSDSWTILTLQFYQYDQSQWKKLLSDCAAHQSRADDMIRKIQE